MAVKGDELPEHGWYRAHEFAALAGVTVRTLHHYDRAELLRPMKRSQAGYRLYRAADLERLEQILALKSLGLSLAQIRSVLQDTRHSLLSELERQRSALVEKRRLLDSAIAAIDELQASAQRGEPTTNLFRRLIQVIAMQNDSSWMMQYYSPEAQKKIAERAKTFTLEMQKEIAQAWRDYYRDLRALQTEGDPDGSKAAELAKRHKELIGAFTGDDPEIEAGLKALFRDRAKWPDTMKTLMAEYEGGGSAE